MRFSQRIGKKSPTKEIQLEFIDEELKNGLWNLIKLFYLDKLGNQYKKFAKILWHKFYKLPIDTIPYYPHDIEEFIRDRFFNEEWYEVYDFIEFLLNTNFFPPVFKARFIQALNELFEEEFSGYRIIDGKVAPISNKLEFGEVTNAIDNTYNLTALNGANIHLKNALELLSNKKHPDYRNSIKESISAVEATCRVMTSESTLGKALKKLEDNGLKINPQLKSGFDKIYAYTNDKKNGIRHAIIEQPFEPDYDDAKYMLVVCSSFVNYLIGKANKIGILIKK